MVYIYHPYGRQLSAIRMIYVNSKLDEVVIDAKYYGVADYKESD